MIQLIDELKVIPGVVGACIVNFQDGLKVTNLPAIFKPERLLVVGKHLLELYSAGRASFSDLTDITLNYDESVIVARELEKGSLVFVICDPTFNHNLMTMSLNLLQEEYKLGNFATAESPVGTPAQPQADVTGEIQDLLEEMKGALSKILGPMAGFVFDEVAEEWIEQGASGFSRIEVLIDLLNQEISDQDKINSYRQLISPALKAFQKG
ncbi:MAG: hypothetical protein U9Q61_11030 [Thermodesulfobacteriota bacterium]|nr:hypothetical protein [Thermodesulfobacteriota bacterium]